MSTIVQCPNPGCPFRFDSALVPPGALIACPQCQLQFTLGSAVAPEVADEPVLVFSKPANRSLDDDSSGRKSQRKSNDAEDDDEPPKRGGPNIAAMIVAVVIGFVVICTGSVLGLGYFAFGWFKPDKGELPGGVVFKDYEITLPPLPEGWSRDDGPRESLKANLAGYKRTDGGGFIAVDSRKVDGDAKKGELLPRIKEQLGKAFEEIDEDLHPSEVKFLGQPGEKYEFRGVYRSTQKGCRGEVHAVAIRNFYYWFYTWAPTEDFDARSGEFETFRSEARCTATIDRGTAKPTRQEKLFRTNLGSYSLGDSESLWAKQDDPTRQDAKADLWLKGTGRSAATGKPTMETANMIVAILDSGADAKKHILEQFTEGATVTELQSAPTGESPGGTEVAASDSVVRLKLVYEGADASVNKLVVYSTIEAGGKKVVAYASCELKQMAYWEQRMMLIAGTLKGLR